MHISHQGMHGGAPAAGMLLEMHGKRRVVIEPMRKKGEHFYAAYCWLSSKIAPSGAHVRQLTIEETSSVNGGPTCAP